MRRIFNSLLSVWNVAKHRLLCVMCYFLLFCNFILLFDSHRVVSGDYYYPTLHQYKIELEDALTSLRDQSAYFRYDESEFPGFSWRGYAVFSQAQVMRYEGCWRINDLIKITTLFLYLKNLAPVKHSR